MARKSIPKFKSEAEEQDFWAKHDSTEFIDWYRGGVGLFPELKPSTQTISIRLPKSLLEALKVLANKRDVPYQSLLKVFLAERLNDELVGIHLRDARGRFRRLIRIQEGEWRVLCMTGGRIPVYYKTNYAGRL